MASRIGQRWDDSPLRVTGLAAAAPPVLAFLLSDGVSRRTARSRSVHIAPPDRMTGGSAADVAGMREGLARMQEVADRLLETRVEAMRRAEDRLTRVSVAATVIGLLAGLLAAYAFTTAI